MKGNLFLVVIILFSFLACKNKKVEKSVVGKWKPAEVNIPGTSENDRQAILDSVIIEFTADSQIINTVKGAVIKGTFSYKDKTLTATMPESPDMPVQQFKTIWEGDTLVLKNQEGEMKFIRQ